MTKESNQFQAAFIQQASKKDANRTESFPLGYGLDAYWIPIKSGGMAARIFASGALDSSIKATARAVATITGISTVVSHGNMGKQINANLSGVSSVSSSSLKGNGNARAKIQIGASPSSIEIADAIWSRSSVPFTVANTMGKKLNDAGSSTNPWGADF